MIRIVIEEPSALYRDLHERVKILTTREDVPGCCGGPECSSAFRDPYQAYQTYAWRYTTWGAHEFRVDELCREIERLRARIAVLEARRAPVVAQLVEMVER
jgi:hypothetical protein